MVELAGASGRRSAPLFADGKGFVGTASAAREGEQAGYRSGPAAPGDGAVPRQRAVGTPVRYAVAPAD